MKKFIKLPEDIEGYLRAVFRTMGVIFISAGTFLMFGSAPLLKFIPLLILSIAIMSAPYGRVTTEEAIGLSLLNMVLGIMMVLIFTALFWSTLSFNTPLFISIITIAAGFFITFPSTDVSERDDIAARMLKKFYDAGKKFGEGLSESIPGANNIGWWAKILFIVIILSLVLYFSIISGYYIIGVYPSLPLTGNVGSEGQPSIASAFSFVFGIVMMFFSILLGAKFGRNFNGVFLGVMGGIGLAAGSIALSNNFIALIVFSTIVGAGILSAVPADRAKTLIGIPIVMLALFSTTIAYPDVMGVAVFGQWWPSIETSIQNTISPILENVRSPFETLQFGYECLKDPIACQQRFEPKTHTKEIKKSVEIVSLEPSIDSVTLPGEKFFVLATIENKGNEEIKNIHVGVVEPVYTHTSEGVRRGDPAGDASMTCPDTGETGKECIIDKLIPGEVKQFMIEYTLKEDLIGGNYISYGINLTYDFNVKGQLRVLVYDSDYMDKLSKNKKLSFSEQITEDTGGPVRLGLAVMKNKMPIRDNLKGVPVMLYLENQLQGTVMKINKAVVDVSDLEGNETYCTLGGGGKKLTEVTKETTIEPREYAKFMCISQIPDIGVEQKTFTVRGDVEYTYLLNETGELQIDFGSYVLCRCCNEEDKCVDLRLYNCDVCSASICPEGYKNSVECIGGE